jgi:glycosyltransferase involved in cell wall biosynthesis
MVRFNIVTVVRNDLVGLKATRKSIENQGFNNWLHIIIDGASTDGTEIYGKNLPKENTIFLSEPDTGIYSAMNKSLKFVQPESFVYFLNARDVFSDNAALQYANEALDSIPSVNWGCTTHEEIGQDGDGWVCKLVSPPSISNQLYAFGYRSHQGVVMRGSFIQKLGGFNETFKLAADWDLITRALLSENPIVWQYPLGRFELGGISTSQLLNAHLELMILRRIYLEKTIRKNFADRIWCALYLRELGYRNVFSGVLLLFYPSAKKSSRTRSKGLLRKKLKVEIEKHRRYSGAFTVIGKALQFYNWLNLKLHRPTRNFRARGIRILHEVLDISPYSINRGE